MIAILRNPVERAYPFFTFGDSREPLRDFSQALRKEEARICDNWSIFGTISRQGFTTRSCNGLPNLTRSRLEFIYLKTSTLTRWRYCRIFSLLGVSETFVPDISVKQNASVMPTNLAKPALTTQVRQQLIEVYREDIWRLSQNLSSGIFKLGRARECYRSPAKVIMLVKP